MSKRPRNDTLTGGTKDVNPQTLGGKVTESAANTFTEVEISVPVLRVTVTPNRAQVIEVLKVEFQYLGELFNLLAEQCQMSLTTRSVSSTAQMDNSNLLAMWSQGLAILTTGGGIMPLTHMVDLTDGDGHGLIVANPSIFFSIKCTGLGAASTGRMRIIYRFKNVGLQEFIGLAIQQATS